jgi:ribosomal protein S18 acetylase RimI-like enzyme
MAVDAYVGAFRERVAAMRAPGQELIDEPGIVGLIGRSAETLDGRTLVTDDRALDLLSERLPALRARVVNVFTGAEACHRLVSATGDYRSEAATAMVSNDLDAVPDLSLPDGLTLRAVSRTPGDVDGVPLEDAAAAALRSDPTAAPTGSLDGFVEYLRSVPNALFFAAVDDNGVVQATAASANWNSVTGVFFVDTVAEWRGRGVGTAMTAAALRAAAAAGATRAYLDSSNLGLSIYRRLGFESISECTLFVAS